MQLELDGSVAPVNFQYADSRSVRGKLKAELDRLEQKGVVAKVMEPTDWVSSLVVERKKNGSLRLCIDPKPLNKALKRAHYPLPIIDDVLAELPKARVFSILDAKNGFWHLELDHESSMATTMATPFGRYRWKRLPFGVSPAPELFQRKLDENIAHLDGVKAVADDILVYGEGDTDEEAERSHDQRLIALLKRAQEVGLKFNKEKFRHRLREVPYVGHELTSHGLKVASEKVKAIHEMPAPKDVKGVRQFIGLANYMARFIPNLSGVLEPLRQLTCKENAWAWEKEHEEAVEKVKLALASAPVLKYFDQNKQAVVQADASDYGLGAVLMQEGHAVAYASRSLTPTERRYAQIEKELLAVVFGLEKFHQYVYGKTVVVESDHRPLEIILKRPLRDTPKRLQRMLLRLQRYDISLRYTPGKHVPVADALSRLMDQTEDNAVEVQEESDVLVAHVSEGSCMTDDLAISDGTLSELRLETQQDEEMAALHELIQSGWPEKRNVPTNLIPFFHHREELTLEDGLIFKGDRCVVPKKMRRGMLKKLHSSHMGVESCLRRARETVYWPGITAQLRDYIGKCDVCCSDHSAQPREPLLSTPIPDRPWEVIGTDLFSIGSDKFLVTVDYLSGFWEVDQLTTTTSLAVIRCLKRHIGRYGIPKCLRSDNGPQYASDEFKRFCEEWGIQHITSSPRYPASNGKAESAVKAAKDLILKARKAKEDPWKAILEYRNVPTAGLQSSPIERFLGRQTRSTLPIREDRLNVNGAPKDREATKELLEKRQTKQKKYYDRSARELPQLLPGDIVRIQPPDDSCREWKKAKVESCVAPRSYEVVTEEGQCLRRNRRHLRKSPYESFDDWRNQHQFPLANNDEFEEAEQEEIGINRHDGGTEEGAERNETDEDQRSDPGENRRRNVTRSGRTVRKPRWHKDYTSY